LLEVGILQVRNIILTEQEDKGFLIDFDLALKTANTTAPGAPSKTSGKIFMAIGALLGEEHSFRSVIIMDNVNIHLDYNSAG